MTDHSNVANFNVLAKDLWQPFLSVLSLPRHETRLEPEERKIQEVIYDYCHNYDAGNVDGMMKLFAPDAIMVNALGQYRGHDEIRKNYQDSVTRRLFGFHYVTNICVRISSANEAIATCYLFTVNMLEAGLVTFVSGTYVDRLIVIDNGWKFSEKRVTADIRFTAPGDKSIALPPKSAPAPQ